MKVVNTGDNIPDRVVWASLAEEDLQALLRVARSLQDVRIYFANSEILSDVDVFQHPYFKDGIRYAYKALKEAEHLL